MTDIDLFGNAKMNTDTLGYFYLKILASSLPGGYAKAVLLRPQDQVAEATPPPRLLLKLCLLPAPGIKTGIF
jgi:hypothetical protein